MKTQIFKVQRPVHDTSGDRPWLFYNRDRSILYMVPEVEVPAPVVTAVGSRLKAFLHGTVAGLRAGKPSLENVTPAEDQPW